MMLGFTKTEERIIVILICTFLVGSGIRWIQVRLTPIPEPVVQTRRTAPDPVREDSRPRSEVIIRSNEKPGTEKGPIALNRAMYPELISVSGIGPVLAERIIQYRESHNGFNSIEELKQVKGIGQKKYENLKTVFVLH